MNHFITFLLYVEESLFTRDSYYLFYPYRSILNFKPRRRFDPYANRFKNHMTRLLLLASLIGFALFAVSATFFITNDIGLSVKMGFIASLILCVFITLLLYLCFRATRYSFLGDLIRVKREEDGAFYPEKNDLWTGITKPVERTR